MWAPDDRSQESIYNLGYPAPWVWCIPYLCPSPNFASGALSLAEEKAVMDITACQFEYEGTEIEKLGGVGSRDGGDLGVHFPWSLEMVNNADIICWHTEIAKGGLARLVGSVPLTYKKDSPSLSSLLSVWEFADMPVKQKIFHSKPRLFLWNQEGWNLMIFKVLSNPYHFMILWFKDTGFSGVAVFFLNCWWLWS